MQCHEYACEYLWFNMLIAYVNSLNVSLYNKLFRWGKRVTECLTSDIFSILLCGDSGAATTNTVSFSIISLKTLNNIFSYPVNALKNITEIQHWTHSIRLPTKVICHNILTEAYKAKLQRIKRGFLECVYCKYSKGLWSLSRTK